jgi:transposase-like protein
MTKTMNKYSPEVRERAVRMVLDDAVFSQVRAEPH